MRSSDEAHGLGPAGQVVRERMQQELLARYAADVGSRESVFLPLVLALPALAACCQRRSG